MNKILEAIKNWDKIEKEKIIRDGNGVGMISFDAEITANNVVKTCKALMDTDYLYIIAEGEGKVRLREKWIEYQWKKNENSQREENEIYLRIKKEQLHEAISDLMESDLYDIVIYDSTIENNFFDALIQNKYDSMEFMKEGLIKSKLYLDLEGHPFDILYSYSLEYEPPSLKGKYYELPFEFE